MTKLSKYFTLEELTVTNHKDLSNKPDPESTLNLKELCTNLLDPIREFYGCPIYVNSGYRSIELNRRVKGSPTSNHIHGCCADITCKDPKHNRVLWNCILKLIEVKVIEVDQLIWEKGNDNYPQWIHIGLAYNKPNRNQILRL